MISQKELKYVSQRANNAPYPGDDYAYDTINNLTRSLVLYRKNFEGKKYKITLSNGEEVNFEIKGWNLAHLLGIDYKMITSLYMKKIFHDVLELSDEYKVNSLVVLNRIIENADKVVANDEVSSIKLLNYYKVMLKTSCFLKLTDFHKFDFGVLDFNHAMFRNITDNYTSTLSNKYIISPTDERLSPYCIMGLKYDESFDAMYPETIKAPSDFSDYLYGQKLILPLKISISTDKYTKEIIATKDDKIKILNFYKMLINDYNVDTYINGTKEILPKRKTLK